jgi:hypothetical protein
VLAIFGAASCGTVPKTSLDGQPDRAALAAVNDSLYARCLTAVIEENGAIRIVPLVADTDLTEYLTEIAVTNPDGFNSRADQLSFWINTHNAYVLDLIRSNTATSIDDISGFRYAKIVRVGGQLYSLDDIEHTIIAKHFREPRAFFALYDGTRSSPALRRKPYDGTNLSDELDAQLRIFLADSTKNYFDRRKNIVYLSKIFSDYRSSLEEMSGEGLNTLVRDFAPKPIADFLSHHPNADLAYLGYDKTIDETDLPIPSHEPANRTRTPTRRNSGGIK